jgi:hypothetical protein
MKFSRGLVIAPFIGAVVFIALPFLVAYPGGRRIVGDYRLVRDDDKTTYKLDDTAQPENQLANTGAVVRIGWDKQHILVKRLASPTRGTPWSNEAGWVVIDVDQKKMSPTMTDAELQSRGDVAHLTTYAPESAFQMGHRW